MVVTIPRQSVCELEVDALASDILNRHELSLGKNIAILSIILNAK